MTPAPASKVRPIPGTTLDTEFFWRSGADGVLRMQRCVSCGALLHPPGPICRYCHGRDISVVTLSGNGTVAAFTVNHQQWLPGFDPPYVIAVVALDDDSRARL